MLHAREPKVSRSSPTRGRWIEIFFLKVPTVTLSTSSPTRGMWIEIGVMFSVCLTSPSSPTRGMWIEIFQPETDGGGTWVIPHTGDVD